MRVRGAGGAEFEIDMDIATPSVHDQLAAGELVIIDGEPESEVEADPNLYPAEGTVDDVLEWAGDDPDRIAVARDAELARGDNARKGVLSVLDPDED